MERQVQLHEEHLAVMMAVMAVMAMMAVMMAVMGILMRMRMTSH